MKSRKENLVEYLDLSIWLRYQPRRRNAGPASWISLSLDQLASWQLATYAQIPALALIASWNTTIQFSPQFVSPSNLLLCSISLLFWQTEIAPLMLAISRHLRKVSTTTLMTAAVSGSGWKPGKTKDLCNNTNIDISVVRRKNGLRLSKMSPN